MYNEKVFMFKQKKGYERRISDWCSDVCSSDLLKKRWRIVPSGRCLFQAEACQILSTFRPCSPAPITAWRKWRGSFRNLAKRAARRWLIWSTIAFTLSMSFRARSAAAASLASLAPGSMLSARSLKQGCSAKGCKVHSKTSLARSEEHTSELQSLMRISYAVFCLKKKKKSNITSRSTLHTSEPDTILRNTIIKHDC